MMKNSELRLFVAIPIPNEIKRQIADWCDHIKKSNQFPFRKWVYEQDYHITLKFLGACYPNKAEQVKQQLAEAAQGKQQFSLSLSQISFFGRKTAPRILLAETTGGMNALLELQRDVEDRMSQVGFEKENRPYRAHITLAKNFTGHSLDYEAINASWNEAVKGLSWEVNSIVLYRTELKQKPMYVIEEEYLFT